MTPLFGLQNPTDYGSDYSTISFMIAQKLLKLATCTLVKVVAVTNTGALAPVGLVDVQPLVTQISADGLTTPHGVLHNVPYLRVQGGANAVVIDPQVGDIGICAFASRDISSVKSARAEAPPGSLRVCDWADGMYLGGALNAAPTQYVQFSAAGITVHSPVKVIISAPVVEITAPNVKITGAIELVGPVSQTGGASSTFSGPLAAQGTDVHTHAHAPGSYTAGGDPVTGASGAPT